MRRILRILCAALFHIFHIAAHVTKNSKMLHKNPCFVSMLLHFPAIYGMILEYTPIIP